jgi:hypothetical protein
VGEFEVANGEQKSGRKKPAFQTPAAAFSEGGKGKPPPENVLTALFSQLFAR